MSLILAGCGLSPVSRAKAKKYEIQGRENAVNYIKEKYGFIPSVTDTKAQYPEGGPVPYIPDPNGLVVVSMKYEDKEFAVEISGEEKTTEGADSYQKPEILSSIKQDIKKMYPDVVDVSLPFIEHNGVYFEELYTGENISDFIEQSDFVLKLCDTDVYTIDYQPLFDRFDCDSICIINYNNTEKMPVDTHYVISSSGYDLDNIMPYINQYLYVTPYSDEPYFEQVYTYEYDGFRYCTLEDVAITVSPLTKKEKEKLEGVYDISMKKGYDIRMVAGYHVKADIDELIVAVPLSYEQDGTIMEIKPLATYSYDSDESNIINDSDYLCTQIGHDSGNDYIDDLFGVFLLNKENDEFMNHRMEELDAEHGNL